MKYEVAISKNSDAAAMYALLKSAWEHYYRELLSTHQIQFFLKSWPAEKLERKILDPNSVVLIARDDTGKITGFVFGETNVSAKSAVLSALYIAPGLQGKGLGFQLFSEIVKEFISRGLTTLSLRTFDASYKTKDFYRKMGGKESPSAPYFLDESSVPCVSYRWDSLS